MQTNVPQAKGAYDPGRARQVRAIRILLIVLLAAVATIPLVALWKAFGPK